MEFNERLINNEIIGLRGFIESKRQAALHIVHQTKNFIESLYFTEFVPPRADNTLRVIEIDTEMMLIILDDTVSDLGNTQQRMEYLEVLKHLPDSPGFGSSIRRDRENVEDLVGLLPELRTGSVPVQEVMKHALRSNRVLILGENHSDPQTKQLLIDFMGTLHSEGVRTLFLERRTEQQALVDEIGPSTSVPQYNDYKISRDILSVSNLGSYDPEGTVRLIHAARSHGIQVRLVDTPIGVGYEGDRTWRLVASNRFTAGNILSHLADRPGEKAVVLVGAAHSQPLHGGLETFIPNSLSMDPQYLTNSGAGGETTLPSGRASISARVELRPPPAEDARYDAWQEAHSTATLIFNYRR